jgi:hypothetical protein
VHIIDDNQRFTRREIGLQSFPDQIEILYIKGEVEEDEINRNIGRNEWSCAWNSERGTRALVGIESPRTLLLMNSFKKLLRRGLTCPVSTFIHCCQRKASIANTDRLGAVRGSCCCNCANSPLRPH